nr:lisH domain-containing protein C1711.05-like [Ipomoea trifida]
MKYQGNDKASGSRTHDKDELQVLCYNCRKPEHFKAECPYPIVKKHQDEHNYKKNSGRYHHPKKSDSSEDEKGLLCLFNQEDSDEEMCLMAEEEEVTSQNQSSNYSSESVCHENPREAFEKMMKSFFGIEDSHLKLKEENAKLLAERQDLEDLKSKNA